MDNKTKKKPEEVRKQRAKQQEASLRSRFQYTIATLEAEKRSKKGVEKWSFQMPSQDTKSHSKALRKQARQKPDYQHTKGSIERARQIAKKRGVAMKKLIKVQYMAPYGDQKNRYKLTVIGLQPARLAAFLLQNPNAVVMNPGKLKKMIKAQVQVDGNKPLNVWLLPERVEGFLEQHQEAKILNPRSYSKWKEKLLSN